MDTAESGVRLGCTLFAPHPAFLDTTGSEIDVFKIYDKYGKMSKVSEYSHILLGAAVGRWQNQCILTSILKN